MRTEEAILEATLRLLATRGIRGMSLDLLSDEVGVAKSSILWHFGSKEELLLRVAERALEEVARGPAQEMLALPTIEERADAAWHLGRPSGCFDGQRSDSQRRALRQRGEFRVRFRLIPVRH
jgi:AcrR family transcriptional regulator